MDHLMRAVSVGAPDDAAAAAIRLCTAGRADPVTVARAAARAGAQAAPALAGLWPVGCAGFHCAVAVATFAPHVSDLSLGLAAVWAAYHLARGVAALQPATAAAAAAGRAATVDLLARLETGDQNSLAAWFWEQVAADPGPAGEAMATAGALWRLASPGPGLDAREAAAWLTPAVWLLADAAAAGGQPLAKSAPVAPEPYGLAAAALRALAGGSAGRQLEYRALLCAHAAVVGTNAGVPAAIRDGLLAAALARVNATPGAAAGLRPRRPPADIETLALMAILSGQPQALAVAAAGLELAVCLQDWQHDDAHAALAVFLRPHPPAASTLVETYRAAFRRHRGV